MTRYLVACALGLWAGPIAAQELHLNPPTMSARAERCTAAQRAVCDGMGRERAIESNLTCDACASRPLPPDAIAPAAATRTSGSPECLPGATEPAPRSCTPPPPPVDAIPRP